MDVNPQHSEGSTEDAYMRHLSVRLYDILDRVGASDEIRKLRHDSAISWGILHTLVLQLDRQHESCFIVGSSCEGTTTPGLKSDLDILYWNNISVIEDITEAGEGNSFLMIRDQDTKPGYVKLQHVFNKQPQTVTMRAINSNDEAFDEQGRICAKHLSGLGLNSDVDERHGPADTNTKGNIDYVHGYRCSKIPQCARKWIGRQRPYQWPSKLMLDKMSTLGCFLVGVGHSASTESNIEWRLSFSLQERELMLSLNPVQHKCYVALKMIKKDIIEPIVGKAISSYHIKTSMFHTIENTNSGIWKRENLAQCVCLNLFVLLTWVYNGNCPNYFINEENMFDRDLYKTQRLNVMHQLHMLLSNICGVLFRIKLDQIGILLKNDSNINHVESESEYKKAVMNIKVMLIDCILVLRKTLYDVSNVHNSTVNMILTYLSHTDSIMDHSKQHSKMAISYILPCLHLQLAQSFASSAFREDNTESIYVLLQKSGYHLRQGRWYNLTLSLLLEATVLFKLEQYQRCISILKRLELYLSKKPLSLCSCYLRQIYVSKEHVRKFSTFSVDSILFRTSTCMIFRRSDMPITPEALTYEMFRSVDTEPGLIHEHCDSWFDMAVVDASVYLHFLQYLVQAKLNKIIHKHVAIHKLESILLQEQNLGHRETGYNLLGWIYFHENWKQQGMPYFQKSLSIRPFHNAARLQIRNICKSEKRM